MFGQIGTPELVVLPAVIIGTIFWLWMLVDCVSNEDREHRLIWALIVIFTHFLGAVVYYFTRRRQRLAASQV